MAQALAPQMQAVRNPPPAAGPVPILYGSADGTGVPVRKSEALGHKAKGGGGDACTRDRSKLAA